ncbi:porin family protein [Solitalea lacus]|uniref:porin family protein n=1 Tax=Solitalea lacus TaxID=2911172 RepID=UPI001EDB3597|nr:porin family protein [Solitalea lacus]UKJ07458.1 PorT family protein [Solitalea lacus]
MRKSIITLVLIVMAGIAAHAQNVKFGIKGGLNMAKVSSFKYYGSNGTYQEEVATDYKPGFHAGIFVDVGFSRYFSFQPELMYSQKGYKSRYMVMGNERTTTVSYNYLDLPLLAKIKTGTGLNFYAGPSVSFLLSSRYKDSGSNVIIESENNAIDEDNFRKADIGGLIGVGYDFGKANLGLNYNFGLQTLDKYDSGVKARNNNIQLSIGFNF